MSDGAKREITRYSTPFSLFPFRCGVAKGENGLASLRTSEAAAAEAAPNVAATAPRTLSPGGGGGSDSAASARILNQGGKWSRSTRSVA